MMLFSWIGDGSGTAEAVGVGGEGVLREIVLELVPTQ
jgi:hypothetical protein